MSLFLFNRPSLAQALNLAQYMSLVLFYMPSFSPSFKIKLNIRG